MCSPFFPFQFQLSLSLCLCLSFSFSLPISPPPPPPPRSRPCPSRPPLPSSLRHIYTLPMLTHLLEKCLYWSTSWTQLFLTHTWLDPIPSIDQTVEDAAFSPILLSCVCLRLLPPIMSILEFIASEMNKVFYNDYLEEHFHSVCIILYLTTELNGSRNRWTTSYIIICVSSLSILFALKEIQFQLICFSPSKFFTIVLHSRKKIIISHFKLLVQYGKNERFRYISIFQPTSENSKINEWIKRNKRNITSNDQSHWEENCNRDWSKYQDNKNINNTTTTNNNNNKRGNKTETWQPRTNEIKR